MEQICLQKLQAQVGSSSSPYSDLIHIIQSATWYIQNTESVWCLARMYKGLDAIVCKILESGSHDENGRVRYGRLICLYLAVVSTLFAVYAINTYKRWRIFLVRFLSRWNWTTRSPKLWSYIRSVVQSFRRNLDWRHICNYFLESSNVRVSAM